MSNSNQYYLLNFTCSAVLKTKIAPRYHKEQPLFFMLFIIAKILKMQCVLKLPLWSVSCFKYLFTYLKTKDHKLICSCLSVLIVPSSLLKLNFMYSYTNTYSRNKVTIAFVRHCLKIEFLRYTSTHRRFTQNSHRYLNTKYTQNQFRNTQCREIIIFTGSIINLTIPTSTPFFFISII